MLAVIFEIALKDGKQQAYLDHAASLRDMFEDLEGFISVERFESLMTPGKLLSLSFWKDEAALDRWRNMERHRAAQQAGRGDYFADYRLRIAGVMRDYGMNTRDEAPADSRAIHD